MKKSFIFLFACLIYPLLLAAQKHDYNWLFGYNYTSSAPLSEGFTVDFNKDSIYFHYAPRKMQLDFSAQSYSDSLGNLEIYTNGCYIASSNMDTIFNGDELNPGHNYDLFCNDPTWNILNVPQYGFFLQNPKNADQAILFHVFFNLKSDSICYTVCEKDPIDSTWAIIDKNHTFHRTVTARGGLMACKHANGRDWWILAREFDTNRYFTYLFDGDGVYPKDTMTIGPISARVVYDDWAFSPDGSRLAIYNKFDDLRLFDFDRCTGQLSNPDSLRIDDIGDDWLSPTSGCAWSHDGSKIYLSHAFLCYQLDLDAPDWKNTLTIIGEEDPSLPANRRLLGWLESGPDGRIYNRGAYGSPWNMHVIQHPNRAGTAADFRFGYYDLEYPIASIPMFPNYRLGPIDGSPCDTLGLNNRPLAGYRYDRIAQGGQGGLNIDFTEVTWYQPDTWLWDFGDPASGAANSSSEKYPVHTFSQAGEYEVCLTASNQYGSDTHCKTIQVYGTSSVDGGRLTVDGTDGFVVYPNPTADVVFWKKSGGGNSSDESTHPMSTVLVFDATGRLVLSQNADNQYIDLKNLPEGLYRLVLRDAVGRMVMSRNVARVAAP